MSQGSTTMSLQLQVTLRFWKLGGSFGQQKSFLTDATEATKKSESIRTQNRFHLEGMAWDHIKT